MFLVLDGPDGSGKTTLANALAERLRTEGAEVLFTYEPTRDSPYGPEIRAVLTGTGAADPVRTAELMTADRAWHLEHVIQPALSAGTAVICDRYKYSTIAYQQAQGVPLQILLDGNRPFPAPDAAVLLLPKSAAVLMERIGARGGERERFEKQSFLEQVIRLYTQMPAFFPGERFLILDAEEPVSDWLDKIGAFLREIRQNRQSKGGGV